MTDRAEEDVAPRWYVIQSRPRQAERAESNLQNQGFTTYLPQWRVDQLRGGKRVERMEALLPNYLFIQLARGDGRLHKIRSTRGVARLVRFGSEPTPVPSAVMEEIRTRSDDGARLRPALTEGDRVIIEKGCFRNLEAVFHCFDGTERAVLFLRLLEQQTRLTLPLESLHRA
jgi:transcriptional antiterminator RfaH